MLMNFIKTVFAGSFYSINLEALWFFSSSSAWAKCNAIQLAVHPLSFYSNSYLRRRRFLHNCFLAPGLFGFLVIFPPRTFFGEAFVFIGFEAFSTGAKISLNTILFIANFDLIHLNIFVSVALMAILNWQRSGST